MSAKVKHKRTADPDMCEHDFVTTDPLGQAMHCQKCPKEYGSGFPISWPRRTPPPAPIPIEVVLAEIGRGPTQ